MIEEWLLKSFLFLCLRNIKIKRLVNLFIYFVVVQLKLFFVMVAFIEIENQLKLDLKTGETIWILF